MHEGGEEVVKAVRVAIRACMAIAVAAMFLPASAHAGQGATWASRVGEYRVVISNAPFGFAVTRHGKQVLEGLGKSFRRGGVRYATLGFTPAPPDELTPPEAGGKAGEGGAGKSYVAVGSNGLWYGSDFIEVRPPTNAPDHRRMRLRFVANKDGTLSITAGMLKGKAGSVFMSLRTSPDEAFHGFGGRREGTNLRGSDIRSWVLDYRYPDPTTAYYAPVPGFVSSRGYGLLLKGDRISRWRMASDRDNAWRLSTPGSGLDLTLSSGGLKRSMSSLSARTGRHRLPPAWSTGVTLSRAIGVGADSGGGYQARVESDLAHIPTAEFPISAYAFEGWQTLPDIFVKDTIADLKAQGIHAILYLRSFVSQDTAGTEAPGNFDYAVNRKLVATKANGDPFLLPSPFPGADAAVIDFTNPAAVKWWKKRVWALLDTGAEGFMNDFGEQVEPGMKFHDGTPASLMHNRYPALQAKVTREAIDAWEKRNPGRKVYFFQRAGFVGSLSSAKWENAQFPGDETVDWGRDSGLPSIIPDMLNRAILGAPGFSTDIGGYSQFRLESPFLPPPDDELFVRWAQAAALTPFFRVHNSGLSGARMPWDLGTEAKSAWNEAVDIHERSRPLIRELWKQFLKTGVPMVRPMYMAKGFGSASPRNDDQWMVGDDLVVAPVVEEGATSRPVRLPAGCWQREGAGQELNGPVNLTAEAPLDSLPWFSRCGKSPLG